MTFHKTATLYMCVFLGVIIIATWVALGRKSGNTGMDMGKIQLSKYKEVAER